MPKIFEIEKGTSLVVCDNPTCDYEIPRTEASPSDTKEYINMLCPQCGENLLTENDYNSYKKFMKTIDRINYWFGWIMCFVPKRKQEANRESNIIDVHVHEGVHIKKRDHVQEK